MTSGLEALIAFVLNLSPALAAWPPNTNQTISGTLSLEQSIQIDCVVTVNLSIDGSGDPTITGRSFAPGSFLCGGVVSPSGTWTAAWGPGANEVTLSIGASSVLGSCFDTVVADFNHTTNTLTFNNVTVSRTPSDCYVDGSLS